MICTGKPAGNCPGRLSHAIFHVRVHENKFKEFFIRHIEKMYKFEAKLF